RSAETEAGGRLQRGEYTTGANCGDQPLHIVSRRPIEGPTRLTTKRVSTQANEHPIRELPDQGVQTAVAESSVVVVAIQELLPSTKPVKDLPSEVIAPVDAPNLVPAL